MRWFTSIVIVACLAGRLSAEEVHFTTHDGVELAATYYPVATATAEKPVPAVLLVHGVGTNRRVWEPVAKLLQHEGMAALAVDIRGHGESIRRNTPDGVVRLDPSSFRVKDFNDMLFDFNKAVDWLEQQPGVDTHRIAVVGAGMTANIALRYSLFHDELAALALLSPAIQYQGVPTDDIIKRVRPIPLRIYVGQDDKMPFDSCRRLVQMRKDAGRAHDEQELVVCSGNVHATDILTRVQGFPQMMVGWLKEVLLKDAAAKP